MMVKTDIERIVDERLAEMRRQMIEELQGQVESEDKSKTIWDLKIEDEERYYRLFGDGDIDRLIFNADNDERAREVGNAFLTKEEAEFEAERRRIEAIMRKYSKPFENEEENHYICYDYVYGSVEIRTNYTITDRNPYFESEEIAQKVIDEIGEDRLKKYWFGI